MLLMAYLDRHSKVISLTTNDFICCISLIGDKDITISVFQRREKEKSCCRNTPSSSSDSFMNLIYQILPFPPFYRLCQQTCWRHQLPCARENLFCQPRHLLQIFPHFLHALSDYQIHLL